jgi:hypothetical protein
MSELSIPLQFIAVFVSNLLFIYFRTLNVTYNATNNRFGVFWSGALVHVTWLVSTTIGVNALIEGNYILILASTTGGLLGADVAIMNRFKHKI